jgi:hypothetical protein
MYNHKYYLLNSFDYTRYFIKALYPQTFTGDIHYTQAGNDIVNRIYFRDDNLSDTNMSAVTIRKPFGLTCT